LTAFRNRYNPLRCCAGIPSPNLKVLVKNRVPELRLFLFYLNLGRTFDNVIDKAFANLMIHEAFLSHYRASKYFEITKTTNVRLVFWGQNGLIAVFYIVRDFKWSFMVTTNPVGDIFRVSHMIATA